MWEDNLGKAKVRRNKNLKPYERPKSILRRVTDSVTGLLPQPSWLVNWLQSSTPKLQNVDNEDIEEEQPVPSTSSTSSEINHLNEGVNRESFIFRRPPGASKEQNNGRATSLKIPDVSPDPVVAEIPRDQLAMTNVGDDDSNSESTSGCSSLLPHPENRRENRNLDLPNLCVAEPLQINTSSLQIIGNSLSKSLSVDLKSSRGRKTLSLHPFNQETELISSSDNHRFQKDEASNSYLDDTSLSRSSSKRDVSQPQLSALSSKRPRFNVTCFGTASMEARRSLLSESIVDSPFYAGRTTYGGASAYRRASLQPSSTLFPYARNRVQARPSSISSVQSTANGSVGAASTSGVVLSSSAQRILQALESMSTPVRDAKRIPASTTNRRSSSVHDEELSFTGFGLSRRRPNLGPPVTKLPVSTPAQLVTRPLQSTRPSGEETKLVSSTPINAQAGGKMRSRKSAPPRESAREAARIRDEEEEEESDLLQAVPMPIGLSSLPSFNLLPTSSVAVTSSSTSSSQSFAIKTSFSSTIATSNGLLQSSTSSIANSVPRPAFTFSAPIVTVSPHEAAAAVSSQTPSFNFSSPLVIKSNSLKPVTKEVVIQEVTELKTGSVLEALGKKISETDSCQKQLTDKPTEATVPVSGTSGFGDRFKPPTDSWTCSICCVSNPKDKSRCLACESPGPAEATVIKPTSSTTSTFNAPPTSGFGDQFKLTSAQWECSVCMVRNSEKDLRCKSCEEPKPGAKPVTTPSSVSNFKFGAQASSTPSSTSLNFKFGNESSSQISLTKKDQPVQEKGTSLQGETNKAETSTGFKFGGNAEEKPKDSPGFKFGSTSQSITKAPVESAGFKFGAVLEPVKSTDSSGFKSGPSLASAPKSDEPTTGFKFGVKGKEESTSTSVQTVNDKVTSSEAINIAPKSEETSMKPETSFFKLPTMSSAGSGSSSLASTTTTAASKSNPIFSFGSATSNAPNVSLLATGSVMDVLGKKSEEPSTSTPVTSSSLGLSFGTTSEPLAPSFSFTKPGNATDKTSVADDVTKTQELQATKSTTSTTATPAPFSFSAGQATSTPSMSFFKPSVNFGSSTPMFGGLATTSASSSSSIDTSATKSFTTSPPSTQTLAFGAAPTTTSTLASTGPASSSMFSFGSSASSTQPSVTSTAAPSTGVFSFGSSSSSTPATIVSTSTPLSTGLFTFGSSGSTPVTTAPAATPSTVGFSFGPPPSSSAPALFSFGSTAPPAYSFGAKETSKAPAAGSGIGFGFTAPSTAASLTGPSTAPSIFAFGSTVPAATPTTTPSETPKLQFGFGTPQQPNPSTAATPAFGSFGSSTVKPASTPFAFGATTPAGATSTFGEMTQKQPVASSFGAQVSTPFGSLPSTGFGTPAGAAPSIAQSATASPFSFGAPTGASAPAFNTTSTFNFGSPAAATLPAASLQPQPQQQTGSVFQFGSAPTPTVNSSFNFGSSTAFTTPDAPSPGFASGLFGANPFDNTGSAAGPNRKIRKAVRRR